MENLKCLLVLCRACPVVPDLKPPTPLVKRSKNLRRNLKIIKAKPITQKVTLNKEKRNPRVVRGEKINNTLVIISSTKKKQSIQYGIIQY